MLPHCLVEEDRGAGDLEKRGRKVYNRRDKKGGKEDFQGGGKRKKRENYATLRNILQSKKCRG